MKGKTRLIQCRVLALVLTLCIFVGVSEIASATDISEVSELLSRLESAYNRMDLYLLVQCFDPVGTTAITTGAKAMGYDGDLFKALMPLAGALFSSYASSSSTWPTCHLTPLEYTGDDYYGVLKYNVNLKHDDGTTENFDESIDVQKIEGKWYISTIQKSALDGTNLFNRNTITRKVVPSDVTLEDTAQGIRAVINNSGRYDRNKYYSFIGNCGKVLLSTYFYDYTEEHGGYFAAQRDTGWGFLNSAGLEVTDFQFFEAKYLGENFWMIKQKNGAGLLNLVDGISIDGTYQNFGIPHQGYIPARKGNYWGLIDYQGNTVVDFIYTEEGNAVYNDLLWVKMNKANAIIDVHGNQKIPFSTEHSLTLLANGVVSWYESANEQRVFCDFNGNIVSSVKDPDLANINSGVPIDTISTSSTDLVIVEGYNHSCYTIDKNANLVTDFEAKVKEQFGDEAKAITVYYNYFDGEKMPIDFRVGGWLDGTTYYNFVDPYGNFLLPNSRVGSIDLEVMSSSIITPVNEANGSKILYNGMLYTVPSQLVGLLGTKMAYGRNWIIDLETETMYSFFSTNYSSKPNIAIVVSDGAFNGIVTEKGLLEKGIGYTKIETIGSVGADVEYGSEKARYFFGKDGVAFRYENDTNISAEFVPLSNGVRISGENVYSSIVGAPDIMEQESMSPAMDEEASFVQEVNTTAMESIALYQGPGINYDVIAEFPVGTEFEVVSDDGFMAYVIVGDKNGFIESRYVTATPDDDLIPQSNEDAEIGVEEYDWSAVTNIEKVNIRTLPDLEADKVKMIGSEATDVKVTGRVYDTNGALWYRVNYEGCIGFIRGDLLSDRDEYFASISFENEMENEDVETMGQFHEYKVKTKKSNVNVRTEANKNAKKVTTIKKKGTVVIVTNEVAGTDGHIWYLVQLENGKTGYARDDFFDDAE